MKTRLLRVVCRIVMLCLAAGCYAIGPEHVKSESLSVAEIHKTYEELRSHAVGGNSLDKHAAFVFAYENASSLVAELPEAIQFLGEAAKSGYSLAQYNLGILYYDGQWLTKDKDTGLAWLLLAAKSDFPDAQIWCGDIYLEMSESASDEESQKSYLEQSIFWLRRVLTLEELDRKSELIAKDRLARALLSESPMNVDGWRLLEEAADAGMAEAQETKKSMIRVMQDAATEGSSEAVEVLKIIRRVEESGNPGQP